MLFIPVLMPGFLTVTVREKGSISNTHVYIMGCMTPPPQKKKIREWTLFFLGGGVLCGCN